MRAANLYETGYQLAKVGKAVDKDEWLMNPQTVNAYYEPSMNVIVFPAAICSRRSSTGCRGCRELRRHRRGDRP